jgi:hypothetical protein
MSVRIELTPDEFLTAAIVGVRRQVMNLRDGRKDAHGANPADGWTLHVEGACGEAAVAKLLNLWWSGNLGRLRAADVGRLQVRTAWRANSSLIIHESDPDDDCFVLVTGRAPAFTVIGWIHGRDAKQPEWWGDPAGGRAAYFVPANVLAPIETWGMTRDDVPA